MGWGEPHRPRGGEHQARTFAPTDPNCAHCGGTGVLLGDVDQPEQLCPCTHALSVHVTNLRSLRALFAARNDLANVLVVDDLIEDLTRETASAR